MNDRENTTVALRQSEAQLRAIFTQAAVGVAQLALDGTFLQANPYFCELVGYSEAELLQTTTQAITHVEDMAAQWEQMQQMLSGTSERTTMQKRFVHKSGVHIWVNLSLSLARQGENNAPSFFISAIQNISERKAAEARLRFLANVSMELATSLDYKTTLQHVAELTVPQLADWCAVDILGPRATIDLVAVAHVDPAKVVWAHELRRRFPPQMESEDGIARVLRTGETVFLPEIPQALLDAAAVDDERRAILEAIGFRSLIIAPLQARQQILGTLTLVWSDSDRRYTQEDLRLAEELARRAAMAVDNARLYGEARLAEQQQTLLNETLELRVAERTAELQRSNRELDQFAYIASHDLRAPLRAIDNLSYWIVEDAAEVLPAPSLEHLHKLRGRVKRMERLLEDLLAYSRAGRIAHRPELVESANLVREVFDLLGAPASITLTVVEPMPTLNTSRVPLETVFRNLIGNAIKHHRRPSGQIWVSAHDQETGVEFSVADDGPGIAPEFHGRIFEMFQTLEPRDQLEGSGIGLAIVKKLVESKGGVVGVESAEGMGARFHFTWPK